MKLYEFSASGNCHKVRLLLSLLGREYESHLVNGAEREHKWSAFLAMNPFGQVPVLADGDIIVRDSQAILLYLGSRYGGERWLPREPGAMAQVAAWLSTAANEVARGPSLLRLHHRFGRAIDLATATDATAQLYAVLETHLSRHDWLALGRPSIADVAIYPYVALSPEAHVNLEPHPAIRAWLQRMQALPGYLGMPGMYQPTS